ncbi:hypothetical protein ACIBH1_45570 [Nonomuraea sp. NPDC050663]|uniref:hypothetical protein n=1 Tax=Nonomuraea sp. NPDC050663 TaxID=3364370 RepID=UPI0037A219F4
MEEGAAVASGVLKKALELIQRKAGSQEVDPPTNAAKWKITKSAKDLKSEVEVPGVHTRPMLQTMTYVGCITGAVLGPIGTLKVLPPGTPDTVAIVAIVGQFFIMALVAVCVTISRNKRNDNHS